MGKVRRSQKEGLSKKNLFTCRSKRLNNEDKPLSFTGSCKDCSDTESLLDKKKTLL